MKHALVLRREGGDVVVTLTSNSGLPWRVRVTPAATLDPPGSVEVDDNLVLGGYNTLVRDRPYTEGLLVPTGELVYRFPLGQLPGRIELKLDLGTHLALSAIFAVDYLLTVFDLQPELLERAELLGCVAKAVEAADKLIGTPSLATVTSLLRPTFACADHIIKELGGADRLAAVVLKILDSGVGIVAAGLIGAWRSLRTGTPDHVTIPLEVDDQLGTATLATFPDGGHLCRDHPVVDDGLIVFGRLQPVRTVRRQDQFSFVVDISISNDRRKK